MDRLITLVFSHYNERARWAMDLSGTAYREFGYLPPFSMAAVAWATRGRGGRKDRVSTRFSCPVLLRDDGPNLFDSGDICRYASERGDLSLYGEPDIDELSERFASRIGPHGRRVIYFHALPDPELLPNVGELNAGAAQAKLFRLMFPFTRYMIRSSLAVHQRGADKSMEIVLRELDHVDALLDGRDYLVGDRFTAADLTLACMLVPLLIVQPEEGYGSKLPPVDAFPGAVRDLAAETRARPAGRHAMRMFAQHRRAHQ